jgi:hypothetical protein
LLVVLLILLYIVLVYALDFAISALQFANEMGHPAIEITGFRLIIDI